jgi:hypothetical protein
MFKLNKWIIVFTFIFLIAITPLFMVQASGGDLIWFETFYPNNRDAGAEGVAVDDTGIYVVGYDSAPYNEQWRIEKRRLNGSILWVQTLNPPGYSRDMAFDVALDDTGLYVAGYDNVLGMPNSRWRIEKRHLENGTIIWTKISNPSSGNDIPWGVTVHNSGLYVAGFDSSPGNNQWRIEKRDPATGNSLWNRTRNLSASDDEANGIAADCSGIYVVGEYVPEGETVSYWRIEKIAFNGTSLWNQSHNLYGYSGGARGVAVDDSGLYVVGYTYIASGDGVWVTEKRDLETGGLIWNQTSNPKVGNSDDKATGIAVDTSGVYAIGYKNNQVWVMEKRTLSKGNVIWINESNPSTTYDWPLDVAVDSSGLYVVGDDGSPGSFNFKGRIEKRILGTVEDTTDSATGTGNVTFSVNKGVLGDLTQVDEASLPLTGKPDLVFPHGFFSFNITGLSPGETVTVNITFPTNIPANSQFWKYHVPEGWINVTSLVGSNDGDNFLTLTLTDGGLGDDDGIANGVIIDQWAPGQIPPPIGGEIIENNLPIMYIVSSIIIVVMILYKHNELNNKIQKNPFLINYIVNI